MFILVFEYELQQGTATACLSTLVLMSVVWLCYIPVMSAFVFKYIAVPVRDSPLRIPVIDSIARGTQRLNCSCAAHGAAH